MSMFQITSLHSLRSAKKSDPIAELKSTGHEKHSRTPIFVGASIAALVMYMRSAHAAPAPDWQDPSPQPDSGAADQAQSHDQDVAKAPANATDTSLPASRRMLPQGQELPGDDTTVRALGQWGWEVTGESRLRMSFGSGDAFMMRGLNVIGGIANDNGAGSGKPRAANARTSAASPVSGRLAPPPNHAPTTDGPVVLDGGFAAMAVLFTLDDLLKGAADPDMDALHVMNVEASSGVVIPVEDGYMYIGDATGPVTLSYDITDGQTVVAQQASFAVTEHAATLGTGLADNIVGSDAGELIQTGAGNDTIHAGSAIDTIYGGDGNDEIHGGAGNDVIVGGAGNDRLFGDAGNDVFFAGAGHDEIHGGDGNDRAYGGDGNDMMFGDAGQDMLFGEAGNDTLVDGAGEDYVDGGDGSDTVLASADRAADTLDGGTGTDTLSYAESRHAVHIDIAGNEARGSDIGTDTVRNFETFVGGQGNDTFVTGEGSVTLYGGAGDDTFVVTVAGIDDTAPVRHVIADFEVGDHVRMSSYDIFEEPDTAPDFLDQMKAAGNGEAPDSAVPIQFRFDDDSHRTFVEADFDHDSVYEASVELEGHHILQLHHFSFA